MQQLQKQSQIRPNAKIVSVSEAKSKLSAVLDWAVQQKDEVIVESRGQPKAVIMAYGEYGRLIALSRQAKRQAALQRLETIATSIQNKNQDLDAAAAEKLADEISREAIERLVQKGKVIFQSA